MKRARSKPVPAARWDGSRAELERFCRVEAVAEERRGHAHEGDLQSISFVALWHPDADVREMWESIYCGILDAEGLGLRL